MSSDAPAKMSRSSNKQAIKLVHGLWQANADASYQRRDMKLRIIGVSAVLLMLVGLWIGNAQGLAWVQIASVVAGLAVFGGTYWTASRNYKADYKRFVVEHLANDGTFLFCPKCHKPMGDAGDEATRENPPRSCGACGGKPWKFERPK